MTTENLGLLELLQRNWDAGIAGLPDDYKAPPIDERLTEEAARLHAKAHLSDPFAYGRIKTHIRRGLIRAEEARSDATGRINAAPGRHPAWRQT